MSEFNNPAETSGKELWCRLEVGARSYCVAASQVLEVAALPPITAWPNAPASLLGIAHLRSVAMPIVDLRTGRADVESRDDADFRYVAITPVTVAGEETLLGLAAHAVSHTSATSGDGCEVVDVGAVVEVLRAAVAG